MCCVMCMKSACRIILFSVVTGCTRGIGAAFSEELAAQGLNIVLISRSLDSLQKQMFLLGTYTYSLNSGKLVLA